MSNNPVNVLVKLPIQCWDINKTLQEITFIYRTLYIMTQVMTTAQMDADTFTDPPIQQGNRICTVLLTVFVYKINRSIVTDRQAQWTVGHYANRKI